MSNNDYPVAATVGVKYDLSKLVLEGWEGEPQPRFQWTFWFDTTDAADLLCGVYGGPKNIEGELLQPLFNFKSLQAAILI